MNKIYRFIQYYLLIGLPIVIIFFLVHTLNPHSGTFFSEPCNVIFGFSLMTWFLFLILFLSALVTRPSFREKMLCRLANLKTRDEREEFITGNAARTSYVSTMSLMIFLLFFSMFNLDVTKLAPGEAPDGHRTTLSISLGYSLFTKNEPEQTKDKVLFDTKHYSLSSSTILLILLSWQLIAFNRAARKEL